MKLHFREHGGGLYRVWTDEQARYGQFDMMDGEDFRILKRLFILYHWLLIEHDD